ncbi:unnamed protein product [Durusdinium trenchii]|uniref:Uncharacterized protein n=1 Tax=Durusdinium trenchii TaxID=1381693 RepID=A0ABP0JIB1_9DINO
MCRIASGTVAALALLGLVAVLTGCSRQRRANLEPSPSALLLWRLGKWHFRRHEDSSALLAYHQAKQVQEQAMTVGSCLTPQLLADIGSAMDSNTSSPVALSQKLEVYEELAFVMESFVWEDHFLQLSDQTEMLKEIGLAAHGLQAVELEMATWKVALRLCLTTRCEQTIRHAELLLRIGVSLSKQPSQDMEKVLDVYEEAEEIFVTLDKKAHPLYAILVPWCRCAQTETRKKHRLRCTMWVRQLGSAETEKVRKNRLRRLSTFTGTPARTTQRPTPAYCTK